MKKFAILNAANKVINIIEAEGDTQELETLFTAHFGSTVKNIPPASLAQKDWFWHEAGNTFICKQPYDSWILNEYTWEWEAPQEYPNQGDPGYEWIEEKQAWVHLNEQTLENYYNQVQYKGMPYTHTDGQVYHIQCRDKDKTNVIGIYLAAKDFMSPGDTIEFTTQEDITIGIERNAFMTFVPQYFAYVSILHHTKKCVETQLETDKTIDVVGVFNSELAQRLAFLQ